MGLIKSHQQELIKMKSNAKDIDGLIDLFGRIFDVEAKKMAEKENISFEEARSKFNIQRTEQTAAETKATKKEM